MPTRGVSTGGAGPLGPVADALLQMYSPEETGRYLAEIAQAPDAMRGLLRLANRDVARDWGLEAAGCLLAIGRQMLDGGRVRSTPRTRPDRT